jgi:predicted DNA binding CopG/RHH family protein
MRKEYDFSDSVKNPYAKKLKKQISLNVETDTIDYFKSLATKTGIPYQTLMNSFLTDCAMRQVEPQIRW